MENFSFYNPTKIIFGRGMQSRVGKECAHYGKRVLLHYGSERIRGNGLFDEVMDSLSKSGLEVVVLGGVQPNPRLSLVRKGIELCRSEKIDLILAVGGGSVIDSAKGIAMGVVDDGDVWDFYTYKRRPKAALPVASVLTIAAAGSEASDSSVLTNDDDLTKPGCTSRFIYPAFSILNPELTCSLPAYQTACGATDILSHLMERYFTNARPVELSDELIEGTMRTVIRNVPRVLANPDDYDARAEIMWSGCVAHNNLLGMGRIEDWGSHGIEHELSGLYDVAHGAGLAVVFPAWMRHVYRQDVARFVRFAVKVWGVEDDPWHPEAVALEGIARLQSYLVSIGMPKDFAGLGIRDNRIEIMAGRATGNGSHTLGCFMELGTTDVAAILRDASGFSEQ